MANTDFLRFNAYSIKDLINRKLSEDSTFTDQIYEGSNLAILIDIFSYMAQMLLYSLNNTASESMFIDTQLYENINRLCNFIGYNPKGMTPASVNCIASYETTDRNLKKIILPYSYVNIGKTDSLGKPIYYSVGNTERSFDLWEKNNDVSTDENYIFQQNITLYNGRWKLYNTVFVSDGTPWQTFVLDSLYSDSNKNAYIAHNFFDVYVVDNSNNISSRNIYKFNQTSFQLFKNPYKINVNNNVVESNGFYNTNDFLYSGNLEDSKNGTIFNLKLNENKNYVISFGDGSTGAIPPKDSLIYIVYLETNGPDGIIEQGTIYNNKLLTNTVNLAPEIIEKYFISQAQLESSEELLDNINITNIASSTIPVLEESVEEIRTNAPNWFKIGNRLVTKSDYEYFIKTHPGIVNSISDIKCMNNWDYICSFYKWLYNLGIKIHSNPKYFLNQNRLIRTDYKIADASDANNVYLWYVPSTVNTEDARNADEVISLMQNITNIIEPIKDLTHEPVILPGLPVRFELCAADPKDAKEWITSGGTTRFIENNISTTYLEITIDNNVIYSSTNIYSMIIEKFSTFFDSLHKLGSSVNFGDLLTMISSIDGINKIRTVYKPIDNSAPIVYNGISMASWTTDNNNLLDEGVDFDLGNSSRSLEQFQYPYFDITSITNLMSQIKIIKTSASSLNQIQY